MKNIFFLSLLLVSLITSCTGTSQESSLKTEVLTKSENIVWGFDFLPDGKILFSEKEGKLFILDPKSKKVNEVTGVPKVHDAGQGGLLDVRVHPKNGYIYFTFSEPVGENSTTALARAKIKDHKLVEYKKLFSATPASSNDHHYGSRVVFDGKGHLFLSVGERGERKKVQDLSTHLGKILRFNEDGSVPKDNPYVGDAKVKPEIWSYGHRNPQGLVMDQDKGELWEAEMGPRGGDELNLIKPKNNYGWPDITYGREYYGPKIGEGTQKSGVTEPVAYWVPSISPSGIALFEGNMFLGTLSGEHIHKVELKDQKAGNQSELFKDSGERFRCLRSGPDGKLWFSTDEGKIARILSPI